MVYVYTVENALACNAPYTLVNQLMPVSPASRHSAPRDSTIL